MPGGMPPGGMPDMSALFNSLGPDGMPDFNKIASASGMDGGSSCSCDTGSMGFLLRGGRERSKG